MRFLRMLTNSLLAGALGAAFLTIIVLQLNPSVPLWSETTWRLFAALGLFYGVHLAVLFYLLMVGREFIGMDVMSPGWVSVRVLAWLTAASSLVASALMWLNVEGFSAALGETAVRRMTAGAAATTATAIVLFGLAAAHYSFGRRGSRVGAALLAIAVFGSLALPLAARGPGVPVALSLPPPAIAPHAAPVSGPRVVMLLLDGASLDYVWPRTAGGRLPNFAKILDTGASMDQPPCARPVRIPYGPRWRPACIRQRTAYARPPRTTCAAIRGRSRCSRIIASRTCSFVSGFSDAKRTRQRRCRLVRSGTSWPRRGSLRVSCGGR